jgi:hypothetical protein
MTGRPHALQVGEVRDGRQAGVQPRIGHLGLRTGFAGHRLLPDRGCVQPLVRPVPQGQEDPDRIRVKTRPGSPGQGAARQRDPAVLAGHVRVLGHLHEPYRQRDLRAAQFTGHAVAVPPFVQMPQRLLDRPGQAHPGAEYAGDITVTGRPLAELRDAAEGRPGHHRRPRQRCAALVSGPHGGGDQLEPGAVGHRHHPRPRRQLVTEEPRVDLALGRAPGEMQQAGVVHGDLVVL